MKYGLGSYPGSSEADIGFIGGGALCRVCVIAGQASGGYPVWMLILAHVKVCAQAHVFVKILFKKPSRHIPGDRQGVGHGIKCDAGVAEL